MGKQVPWVQAASPGSGPLASQALPTIQPPAGPSPRLGSSLCSRGSSLGTRSLSCTLGSFPFGNFPFAGILGTPNVPLASAAQRSGAQARVLNHQLLASQGWGFSVLAGLGGAVPRDCTGGWIPTAGSPASSLETNMHSVSGLGAATFPPSLIPLSAVPHSNSSSSLAEIPVLLEIHS